MRLDISLNYEIAYDCLENLIPPIAKWYSKDYELMLMNSWGFRYKGPSFNEKDTLFSTLFDSGTYSNFEYLEKYHGIQLVRHENYSFEDIILNIKCELNSQKPVIVFNNSYWCPWYTERYKKLHYPHYFLAIGYEDDGIHVIDSQYASNGVFLPFGDFQNGFRDFYICNNLESYTKEINWKGLLKSSISDMDFFSGNSNMFNALKVFSNDIVDKLDLQAEMSDYIELPSASQIITRLSDIGKKRKQYGYALKYLFQKCQINELDILSGEFMNLSTKWSTVFGLLLKAYYSGNDVRLLKRMGDRINELANDEEVIYLKIRSICESYVISNSDLIITKPDKNFDISKCIHVELSAHANNKGIGYDLNPANSSELSDGGRYIYVDNEIANYTICVDKISFKLLNYENRYDNIACKEQTISVNIEPQNYIMLLGCSEWGSHTDTVNLVFEDNSIKDISVELSNVASDTPVFNETMVSIGSYVYKNKTSVDKTPFKASLFFKTIPINSNKAIKSILLPYCPNIHIFAVSFGS